MMPVHMCVSKGERVVLLSLLVFASFVAGFVAFPMMLSAQDVSQPEVAFNESWFSQAPDINNIDDAYLEDILTEVSHEQYVQHIYVNDSYVCLDSAINMWDVLYARGIKSSIMIGNHTGPCYSFACADHAWVIVRSPAKVFAIETTRDEIHINEEKYLQAMEFESPIEFKTSWANYNDVHVIY